MTNRKPEEREWKVVLPLLEKLLAEDMQGAVADAPPWERWDLAEGVGGSYVAFFGYEAADYEDVDAPFSWGEYVLTQAWGKPTLTYKDLDDPAKKDHPALRYLIWLGAGPLATWQKGELWAWVGAHKLEGDMPPNLLAGVYRLDS